MTKIDASGVEGISGVGDTEAFILIKKGRIGDTI
jgi:hypothetical protein